MPDGLRRSGMMVFRLAIEHARAGAILGAALGVVAVPVTALAEIAIGAAHFGGGMLVSVALKVPFYAAVTAMPGAVAGFLIGYLTRVVRSPWLRALAGVV